MKKENLIIVHSFPTNSILLSGLIEYLNDYFNVYFIDLPGFTKDVLPLSKISFDAYSRFVEDKIKEFNLANYIMGGISFGFFIINNIQHPNNCKGIIAMEPYIGPDSLKMGFPKSIIYKLFIKSINLFNLSAIIWNNSLFKTYLPKSRGYPHDSVNIIFEQIDGRTFFETADLILKHKGTCTFQDFPHILIANKEDKTVNYDYLLKAFTENVNRLLVVNTTIDHYPEEPTKAYFQEKIPMEEVEKMLNFLDKNKNRNSENAV